MRLPEKTDLNEILRICIIYRNVSLLASTLVFLFFSPGETTVLRVLAAVGVAAASVIGTYLYRNVFSRGMSVELIVTMVIELLACGLLLVMSGGFISPYLWYFVGLLTVTMAIERVNERYGAMTLVSFIWCLACAFAGWYYYMPSVDQSFLYINICVGFVILVGGFYTLFLYVAKLDQNQQELWRINESLQLETKRSEQALRYTMEIYDTFHLFGITDQNVVMEEMTKLLYRTVTPRGCLLAKTNLVQQQMEVTSSCSCGIHPGHEVVLTTHISDLVIMNTEPQCCRSVDVLGVPYSLMFINGNSGIVGILAVPQSDMGETFEDDAHTQFYFRLVGIILQNIELQAIVEAFIISEEQNRIANEIHDTVLQKLFSIACNIQMLEDAEEPISAQENREQIKHIVKALKSTSAELREAIYSERWETGGQGSFADKLSLYLREMEGLSGTQVDIHFDSDTQGMAVNQKTALYRIVCEAVNNAVKHGKPTRIMIKVKLTDKEWVAEINDDGRGFDKRQVAHKGKGLKNMYRIASSLKGGLLIDSRVGEGTTVVCHLPR